MNIPKSNPISKSGRKLSKLPKIDLSTEGRITNSFKRLNEWLLKEAKIEMQHCSYSLGLLESINLKNITVSDQDTINMMLFGDRENYIELNK
jgi:hypothetical protein